MSSRAQKLIELAISSLLTENVEDNHGHGGQSVVDMDYERSPSSSMRRHNTDTSFTVSQVAPILSDEVDKILSSDGKNYINLDNLALHEDENIVYEELRPLTMTSKIPIATDQVEPLIRNELVQSQPVTETENDINLANVELQDGNVSESEKVSTTRNKTKKRKREPEKWIKNVKKQLKNSGKAYQTVKGRTVPAKKPKPPCTNCRLKCPEKINEESRLKLFEDFWNIGDLTKQRYYIKTCMGVVKPKYSLHNANSTRSLNVSYHFTIHAEKIRPKKDQCSLCLSYQNATGDDKLQLMCAYEQHLKERDLCREDKRADIASCKNDESKIICCYDMQAVLQTPSGNDSLFFYKRRLNVYNCTVYDVVSKAANCYLWNESLGGFINPNHHEPITINYKLTIHYLTIDYL
ncbi:unnamed protein product [Diabrotica balteata]|uniref:Uncharacterized protein n=1 Tax=Diabrotica balteata TaxID=107213 RepID=A0A9N9T3E1_DIABA|nr:unnamed protein product [Diabrotica balteata]